MGFDPSNIVSLLPTVKYCSTQLLWNKKPSSCPGGMKILCNVLGNCLYAIRQSLGRSKLSGHIGIASCTVLTFLGSSSSFSSSFRPGQPIFAQYSATLGLWKYLFMGGGL